MWNLLNFVKIVFTFYIFACQEVEPSKQRIKVYKGSGNVDGYWNPGEWVDVSKCSNLSKKMQASGIELVDVKNTCARLYVETDCKGKSIEIMPKYPNWNLGIWQWRQTGSAGPCKDSCDLEVTGEMQPGETFELVIFNRTGLEVKWGFNVARTVIDVQGCTVIPDFLGDVAGLDTRGICFHVYNNDNCQAEGENVDSVELRKGVIFLDSIKDFKFKWKIRSVSHCRYKCIPREEPVKTYANDSNLIQLYEDPDLRGLSKLVDISKCSNIYNDDKLMSSINTRGICARLYSGWNCTGDAIEVYPRSPTVNLNEWNFDDKAYSVGPCKDPCDTEVTGFVSPGETNQLSIYNETFYKGKETVLTVKGCTLIPQELTSTVESVNTYETCFRLYNNYNCQSIGGYANSIELRKNSPRHSEIKEYWKFPQVKAVSHCSHGCKSLGEYMLLSSTTEDYYFTTPT